MWASLALLHHHCIGLDCSSPWQYLPSLGYKKEMTRFGWKRLCGKELHARRCPSCQELEIGNSIGKVILAGKMMSVCMHLKKSNTGPPTCHLFIKMSHFQTEMWYTLSVASLGEYRGFDCTVWNMWGVVLTSRLPKFVKIWVFSKNAIIWYVN